MSLLSRSIPILAFALALSAQDARAQDVRRSEDYRWSVGGQAGAFIFRTPNQTRGAIPMAGGHMLIKARRGGLYLAVDQAFDTDQQSSYLDGGAPVPVTFDGVRRYTFGLMVFPVYGHMNPFFGLGGGIMHATGVENVGGSSATAQEIGSTGFGTFIAGLQFRVSGLSAFGQYQVQTIPGYQHVGTAEGRLINGTVHSFSGGLRFSLGSSRESW